MHSSKSHVPSFCCVTLLVLTLVLVTPPLQAQANPVAIVLAGSPLPSIAQPGVTVVTLVTSSMPAGTILTANLNVALQVASSSTGPALKAQVTAYAALPVNGGRITFQVQGPNVNAPTPYSVSVSGTTSTGDAFVSGKPATLTINPAAQILSITPSTGQSGQVIVSLIGQFTNYVQGSTSANFGPGISVGGGPLGGLGPVTVTSPTTARAQLTIDPAAVPGQRDVTVATGLQQASLTNGFAISGAPALLSVTPNSGQQGQQDLSVTLVGRYTHWLQGTTAAVLGAGVTVESLTVNSSTTATAVLKIDVSATVGPRNVTLTTGSEITVLNGGFGIVASGPTLLSVSPNSGVQGDFIKIDLVGQGTHWIQGETLAQFGTDVIVCNNAPGLLAPITVTSPTTATATVCIPSDSVEAWLQVPAIGTPPAVYAPSLVYDSLTNTAIAFGGGLSNTGTWSNSVTILSNANGLGPMPSWTPATPLGPAPAPRSLHGAVLDTATNRMIVFGGYNGSGFNDVWVLTNATGIDLTPSQWIQLNPAGPLPAPRWAGGVVYDQSNNRLIIFAGRDSGGARENDVWVLTNANGLGGSPSWLKLAPLGTAPVPRVSTSAVYDSSTNRMIIFGGDVGSFANDTWVLINANGLGGTPQWVQLSLDLSQVPGRWNHTADYDPLLNQMTVFGGAVGSGQPSNDTWVLSNANGIGGKPIWSKQTPAGPPPPVRDNAIGFYDVCHKRLVAFGGFLGPSMPDVPLYTQLWALTANTKAAAVGPKNVTVETGAESVSSINGFNVSPLPHTSAISSSPGGGDQGQTLLLTVIGQNTNFVAGAVQLDLGPDITVNSIQVIDSLTLTAHVNLSQTAAVGFRDVTVTSLGASQKLARGFIVQPAPPPTAVLTPNKGTQNQTFILGISGSATTFDNATTIDLGAGITVTKVVSPSLGSLTATVSISASAAVGARDVVITAGAQVILIPLGFTVQALAAPLITSISPNAAQQGQSGPVAIVGQNTHFVQGTTQVSAGTGITVSNINVTCPTCLTAQFQILAAATPGPVTITATTGSEVASLVNGFTIQPGTPIIGSFGPTSVSQGVQNVTLTVNGQFTHFAQGTTQVSLGAGISISSITIASLTTLTAQISVDPAASVGTRTLAVATGTEVVSVPDSFSVRSGATTLTSAPAAAQQAQTLIVAITGQLTHFVQGTTVVDFGAGIGIGSVTVASSTNLMVQITISDTAATGPRTVTITTGTEIVAASNAFTVNPGTIILSLTPGAAYQNQTVFVGIGGQLTNFVQGTTQASFGPGISVGGAPEGAFGPVTVSGAAAATAQIVVNPSAIAGPRTVQAKTNSEIATFTNGFSVLAPFVISSITPNSAQLGQQNVTVSIVGQNTHFAQNVSVIDLAGAGVTVASVSVTDPLHLSAVINVANNATVAVRDVSATTGPEFALLKAGFTVSGPPSILSISPNNAKQGQTNLPFTITGQNTHFTNATVVDLGAGVTLSGISASDATHLAGNLTVAVNAPTGFRNLTVTTGTVSVSLANAFGVNVGANQPPAITIAPTWSVTLPARLTLTYTVTDDGLPFGGALTTTWSTISGPGNVGFQNQTPTSISVGLDQPGTYVLQISATDTQLTTTQNVTVTVTGTLPPVPTVSITSPTDGSSVTTLTNVTGSVSSSALASWTLEFRMQNESVFRPIATGTTAVTNGILGAFDPTLLLNGNALIQLRATDTAGQTSTAGPVTLVVTGNQKIGNFTVSFNDLSVPVAGLPIQVVRTYDSRNKTIGVFGVGWRLDLSTVTLQTNGALGENWTETSTGGAFPTYSLQGIKPHQVTVTFSDGTTYQFQAALNPSSRQFVPIQDEPVTVTFTPTGITPPNASLAILGHNQPTVTGSVPGPVQLLDLNTLLSFNPDQYQLTLPDGRAMVISQSAGLQSMTDRNGNRLTISANGITHSSGKSLLFTRDLSGRIVKIIDPNGNAIAYTYDANNNLASVKDAAANTTTFTYDTDHGLVTIVDPRGVQPIKNVYDNSGRLIQHVDAFGNTIKYTNNLAGQQEVVTDRLGNITANYYDASGNIVQVTDALGGNTKRTYDARNNLLTETNPLNQTRAYTYDANNNRLTETDALNHTTTYTYNSRNQVLTITDPLGRLTTNTYDANGNLVGAKDASGNITSYGYSSAGLQTSVTDPLGAITSSQYDPAGNLTQQTDTLGNVTSYAYDSNGNRLTQTKTRTGPNGLESLVTSYQYDGLNRLIKTTYPDGSSTQTQYNAIGKTSVTTDQLGRQATYTYDLMGRLTQTAYPDGTNEFSTYDAEGDRITSTDRGGRVTTYTYDALKRLVKTTYADQSNTGTTYDAAGEVIAAKDARGNTTQYQYDAGGHRTAVVDALAHTTSFVYDAVGNQVAMTDANGHTTQFQYDNDNRRTKILYADATTDSVAYDALGRTISKTDQASQMTQYGYDKLGRLVQVTDALSQLTKYSYDEVGNRLSQTDANSHTTIFAYDKLGRRIKRTLPLGMSETSTYDLEGNLQSKTDFNGKTTTYSYDASNRLLSKTPDASLSQPVVRFTYSATGQRLLMVDSSGTTSYTYDLHDRLSQKVTPAGTLSYTYDAAGNLLTIRSSNVGGTSVNYAYDALNRVSTVTENRLAAGTTSYLYDGAGNLQSYIYPNGVQSTFAYNTLNRLTNLTLTKGASLTSYGYALGPAGNRTAVIELGGRQTSYAYDALYRLTSEATVGGSVNGTIGYIYDPAGNRLTRTSSVAAVPGVTSTFDANDRLTSDSYDADGNTTASGGNSYTYDFENHLTGQNAGAVSIVYDGDGNRVAKTTGGAVTSYLVDDRNPTGYSQVLEESTGGTVQRVYTYGLNRISQNQASGTSFYGYDGHGSVRLLTDSTGAVTDRYDYDAFGNIISQSGTTPNLYLYSGEQSDPNLGFYYLRARYLDPSSGRFKSADSFEGNPYDPGTLHRYLYVHGNPVNLSDPSGLLTLQDQILTVSIIATLESIAVIHIATNRLEQQGGKFAGVFASLRTGVDLTGTGFSAGFDIAYDFDSGHSCAIPTIELGISATRGSKPTASGGLGLYTGEAACDGHLALGSTVNVPLNFYKLGSVITAPLAPKLPFSGLLTRLANTAKGSALSVSIGIAGNAASFALTYNGGLGITATLGGQPYSLDSDLVALRSLFGTAVDNVLGTLRTVAGWGSNFTDIDAHAGDFTALVPRF